MAASRLAWLKAFWGRKDAEDGRAPGERLAEHYRRLSYVMRHFRLVSEKQQRATLSMIRSPHLASRSPTIEDRLRTMVRKLAFATRGKQAAVAATTSPAPPTARPTGAQVARFRLWHRHFLVGPRRRPFP